jgi:hypothetical protein
MDETPKVAPSEIEALMDTTFSISKAQLLSVLKGFLIAEVGSVLTTATAWLATGTFDWHVFLLAESTAVFSTAANFARKYIPANVEVTNP